MPWDKKTVGNKICVYKKTTGKIMHCYSGPGADNKADRYLAALHMHAEKEFDLEEISDGLYMGKEDDGTYEITTVSTAALKDSDGETFEVAAIDWDAAEAERTGNYPEYRMFHKKGLGIGKVEKMSRVGIFAVDQGHSYDDPFSKQVCEKILSKNNGKWRCSRGFYLHEASGGCPNCGADLVIHKEHMIAGFRCPNCRTVHMSYKRVLKDLHFRKARTFDVTITDIPAVSYTGVTAKKSDEVVEVTEMLNKKQLKQKLLDAGISEDVIDARLATVAETQLKELGDDIPEATLLKELDLEAEETDEEAAEEEKEETEQTFVLDPSVLKEFSDIVEKQLDGLEIDVETPFEKEGNTLVELKEAVDNLTEMVEGLVELIGKTDHERMKELLEDTPRNGKLRVVRFKTDAKKKKKMPMDEEDMMDQGDDEETEKEFSPDGVIVGSDGVVAKTMTEFITRK